MPYGWVKPRAIRQALYHAIVPLEWYLSVKTHLHVTMVASTEGGTMVQVPWETKTSTSESINAFYASTYVALTCDHITNVEGTKDDHRKQSEKWNIYYKHVYLWEGCWEGEEHIEEPRGCGQEMSIDQMGMTDLYSK